MFARTSWTRRGFPFQVHHVPRRTDRSRSRRDFRFGLEWLEDRRVLSSIGHARATPAGEVTFLDGTTVLDTASLHHGRASFKTASLPLGRDRIQVKFGGGNGFLSSGSAAITVTIRAPRTKPKIETSVTSTASARLASF
jgi:hypothetical protein